MRQPTRPELATLAAALRGLAALLGDDPAAYHESALAIDSIFDAHLQRIAQLEKRCSDLADKLDAAEARADELKDDLDHALGRLGALDGEKSY